MNHIEMMRQADLMATQSGCFERQVGVFCVFGNGAHRFAWNEPNQDGTNNNHAEARLVALVGAKEFKGATLYTTCRPCARCTAMLLPLGLKAVYYRDAQPEMGHLQQLRDAGVLVDGGWITGRVAESWAERNGVAG